MKLPELINRIYFDGRFVERLTDESLSHEEMKRKYQNYEGQEEYQLTLEQMEAGRLYLVIKISHGFTRFHESEKSRAKRVANCCQRCGFPFAIFAYHPDGDRSHTIPMVSPQCWLPINDQLEISHRIDSCGQICGSCQDADPGLAEYIANNRILNSMSV